MDSIFEANSVKEFKNAVLKMLLKTLYVIFISSITYFCFNHFLNVNQDNKNVEVVDKIEVIEWALCAADVEATVYNAVPSQCNKEFGYTASMFYLDLYDIEAHKIIAMERTFMKEFGLVYGDIVKIIGAGKYDGVYQIQDVMNKRFAGQHKIDILVNESIKYGKWNNVKIYTLIDKNDSIKYRENFKPKISKQENKIQMKQKRIEWRKNKK